MSEERTDSGAGPGTWRKGKCPPPHSRHPPCLPLGFCLWVPPHPQAGPALGCPFSLPFPGWLVLLPQGRGIELSLQSVLVTSLQWVCPSPLLSVTCFLPRDPASSCPQIGTQETHPCGVGAWAARGGDIWDGVSRVSRSWPVEKENRKCAFEPWPCLSPSPSLSDRWGAGCISGVGVPLILTPPVSELLFDVSSVPSWRGFLTKDPGQKCLC